MRVPFGVSRMGLALAVEGIGFNATLISTFKENLRVQVPEARQRLGDYLVYEVKPTLSYTTDSVPQPDSFSWIVVAMVVSGLTLLIGGCLVAQYSPLPDGVDLNGVKLGGVAVWDAEYDQPVDIRKNGKVKHFVADVDHDDDESHDEVIRRPMPSGWVEIQRDDGTGEVYYFNSVTKETQLTRPVTSPPGVFRTLTIDSIVEDTDIGPAGKIASSDSGEYKIYVGTLIKNGFFDSYEPGTKEYEARVTMAQEKFLTSPRQERRISTL